MATISRACSAVFTLGAMIPSAPVSKALLTISGSWPGQPHEQIHVGSLNGKTQFVEHSNRRGRVLHVDGQPIEAPFPGQNLCDRGMPDHESIRPRPVDRRRSFSFVLPMKATQLDFMVCGFAQVTDPRWNDERSCNMGDPTGFILTCQTASARLAITIIRCTPFARGASPWRTTDFQIPRRPTLRQR